MTDTKRSFDYILCDESELKGNDLDLHNKAKQRGEYIELTRQGSLVLFKRK